MIDALSPYHMVAIVYPMTNDPATSGKIKVLPCAPNIKHRQLQRVEVSKDKSDYAIEPIFQRAGFVLVRDMFEAEGRLEGEFGWAGWDQCRAAGKRFPKDKMPKEILRRWACGREPDEETSDIIEKAEAKAKRG